uniref:Uncharacterized protein n=1 Tax=Haemonchus contortus TaxID=6289 RepID=A0A7I5E9A2_HAECO|nr:unnamed protein product [Haemonchus contortus]
MLHHNYIERHLQSGNNAHNDQNSFNKCQSEKSISNVIMPRRTKAVVVSFDEPPACMRQNSPLSPRIRLYKSQVLSSGTTATFTRDVMPQRIPTAG